MLKGLERGDKSVETEGEDAAYDKEHPSPLANSLPNEIGTADLGDGGNDEQANGSQDSHVTQLTESAPSGQERMGSKATGAIG